MNSQPVPSDACRDCGTAIELNDGEGRCPTCFDRYLFDIDAGFLESYRKFGCRSRLIVAETCLRGLVLESPDHRKVLAVTIFEQYVGAMNDLVGLFAAFSRREAAPILRSFLEFRLDHRSAADFFEAVQSANDIDLCTALGLPPPRAVAAACPHLDAEDAYATSIAIHHLVQDLRKATDQGDAAALALAEWASQTGGAVIASEAHWLNGAGASLTPDQVALLVLDSRRRSIYVQGLSAEESSMARVVDAIDTATRAASNLIYAYLQIKNL